MSNTTNAAPYIDPRILLGTGCAPYDPAYADFVSYGYVPSLAAGITFCVLFGMCGGWWMRAGKG